MKRVLSVSLLMLVLSFPVFGGHTVAGDYACECGTVGCIEDYEGECSGLNRQSKSPGDGTVEFSIVIVALMLWLRLRA
jgi:hypothetical protein